MTTIEIHEPLPSGRSNIQRMRFSELSAGCAFADAQRRLGKKYIVIRGPDILSPKDCDDLAVLGVARL
jgi:hypothetical protein